MSLLSNKVRLLKEYKGIPAGSLIYQDSIDLDKFSYIGVVGRVRYFNGDLIEAFLEVGICEPVEDRWKPKDGQRFYSIQEDCKTYPYIWVDGSEFRDDQLKSGNCFQTIEQAEEASKRIKQVLADFQKEINQ